MLPVLFDSILSDHLGTILKPLHYPQVKSIPLNIEDTETEYIVTAELPGIKKEDILLTLTNGVLSLEVQEGIKKEKSNFLLKEIYSPHRRRELNVPDAIEESNIKASMENGLLTLQIEKIPKKSLSKKILIN